MSDLGYQLEVSALLASCAAAAAQPCGNPHCKRLHGAALLEAAIILLCEQSAEPTAALDTTIRALQRTRETLAKRAAKGPPS